MTRKSKREIARKLDELDPGPDGEKKLGVAYEDPKTGDLLDEDGNRLEDPDAYDPLVVFRESVVMSRERAEREGYEILGPAEGPPPENDAVEVALEADQRRGSQNGRSSAT